ncbi:MAG: hypothetical protein EBY45_05215 [Gammaproteobacteria bacterium]|nr:hypothetical protein [Gammaproteobacteria bacterium]
MLKIQEQLEEQQGESLPVEKVLLLKTIEMVQENGGISPRTMGLLSKILIKKNVPLETVNLAIKALDRRDVIRLAALVRSM